MLTQGLRWRSSWQQHSGHALVLGADVVELCCREDLCSSEGSGFCYNNYQPALLVELRFHHTQDQGLADEKTREIIFCTTDINVLADPPKQNSIKWFWQAQMVGGLSQQIYTESKSKNVFFLNQILTNVHWKPNSMTAFTDLLLIQRVIFIK